MCKQLNHRWFVAESCMMDRTIAVFVFNFYIGMETKKDGNYFEMAILRCCLKSRMAWKSHQNHSLELVLNWIEV